MKCLLTVLLFAFLGTTFSRKWAEDILLPHATECTAELGISTAIILDHINDDFITLEGNSDTNQVCECIVRKLDALDENNLVNVDVIKPLLVHYIKALNGNISDREQSASDAMESCKEVYAIANGAGDHLVKILNCFVRYIKKQ